MTNKVIRLEITYINFLLRGYNVEYKVFLFLINLIFFIKLNRKGNRRKPTLLPYLIMKKMPPYLISLKFRLTNSKCANYIA